MTKAYIACLAIAFVGASASAATILGPVVNPANGHQYYLLDDATWQGGEAESVTLGGHLTTINDANEQNWVFTTFGTVGQVDRSLWIGYHEVATEGNYVWVNGEPNGYTNWAPGEPNNNGGIGEAFVHMIRTGNGFGATPGKWNDLNSPNNLYPQFVPFGAVAEIVPEPSTLALAAFGFIGLAACAVSASRRRRRNCTELSIYHPQEKRAVNTTARRLTYLLATMTTLLVSDAACGTVVYSGFLAGEDPMTISASGEFTNRTTAFPFSGYVETKALLEETGDWQFHMTTSSEVTNVVISGGELVEASAEISVSRTGQLAGQATFPASVTHTGYLYGGVTVGTNSLHDGALIFGLLAINPLGDLFFSSAGDHLVYIPLTVTVPVSATGSFPVNMRIRSESWGRVGMTFGDFSHTFALTSILLPNGNTPESEGYSLSFDDGATSPNVPEPSTLVLLAFGAAVCVVAAGRGSFRTRGKSKSRGSIAGTSCCRATLVLLSIGYLTPTTSYAVPVVINFDALSATSTGTLFPSTAFVANGVTFTSGSIPNSVVVGTVFTHSNIDEQFLVIGNNDSISPPNFAAASLVFSGAANDLLMSFATPITSLQLTTDDNPSEAPDFVRLLALEATGNLWEFRVLALAEGTDNATTPPGNLLSVDLQGTPFSFALFQTTTEPEGFDDLVFNTVPEPSALVLAALGILGMMACARRRARCSPGLSASQANQGLATTSDLR